MDNRHFVYTTYIKATPELVWKGLTEPAFTPQHSVKALAGGGCVQPRVQPVQNARSR